MDAQAPTHEPINWKNESWLGIAATTVAILNFLATAGLLVASVVLHRKTLGAMSLWSAIPVAGFGLLLAVLGLMHRGRTHKLAHYGIWLNGTIAVFAAPAAMAWSLTW